MAAPESPQSREFRQMRHDVDDVYRLLTETNELAQSGREAIGAVWNGQRRHGTRLEEIQQALDLQNMRADRMEDTQRTQGDRLGRVEGRLSDSNHRLESVDQRLDGVDQRFDGVDQRFDGVDQRFDGVDQRFDGVNQRFDGVGPALRRARRAAGTHGGHPAADPRPAPRAGRELISSPTRTAG